MKLRAKVIENEHGMYLVCGNCGNRLATILSEGKMVNESLPWSCPMCGAEVDRKNGDYEQELNG